MTPTDDVPEITPSELKARLDAGDLPVLVDVREHFETRIADLPPNGQIHVPTGEFLHRMKELDREHDIVVYCRTGSRSTWATRLLMDRGFDRVLNLKGGLMGWKAEVDPSIRAY
jgi:adenylyltransferase/sulfurtransferase